MLFLKELGFPIGTLRTVAAWLCNYIYTFISYIFDLFLNVANFELLSRSDIRPIYQRVTVILSIIMVFYVTFEFVKYIVQPDTLTDKEKGASKIVLKLIIVILLIAFVPEIFYNAYKLQNIIIQKDVLSRVVLGQYDVPSDKRGAQFASKVFNTFYKFEPELWEGNQNKTCDGPPCQNIVDMNIGMLAMGEGMPNVAYKINVVENVPVQGLVGAGGEKVEAPLITFNGLWAVLVGIFLLYILIMYVIDVGARVIHLAFLQIIAPIPIIGYLSPKKDSIFQKWVQQCVTVYLDVFIRLLIIYFILLISNIILNLDSDGSTVTTSMHIVLILGLLLFAQRAPKLLQDLFPKVGSVSGSFGLKPGERFKGVGRVVGFGAGAAVGAAAGIGTGIAQGARRRQAAKDKGRKPFGQAMAGIAGGAAGAVRGAIGGTVRGAANGVKKGNVVKNSLAGAKKQVESNKQFGNRQENGYTLGHQISDRARSTFGIKSRTEELESEKVPYDRRVKERKAEQDYQKKQNDDAFNESTTKNKGNQRVRDAVANYTKINQRFNDLEAADSDARKEYRAGQVRHDKRNEYNVALNERNERLAELVGDAKKAEIRAEAVSRVDKNRFMTEVDYFDSKTKTTTKKKVFARDAYNSAVNAAEQAVYDERKADIDSKFRHDVQNYVYQTDDEAEAARLAELDKLRKDRKSAKDTVQYEYREWALEKKKNTDGSYARDEHGNYIYVDRTRDTAMVRAEEANEQRHVLYNRNASTSQQIDYQVEFEKMRLQLAIEKIAKIKDVDIATLSESQLESFVQANSSEIESAKGGISNAEVEDQWNKRTVGDDIAASEATIRDLTAQQEKVKDEMSGSGIGEGKK